MRVRGPGLLSAVMLGVAAWGLVLHPGALVAIDSARGLLTPTPAPSTAWADPAGSLIVAGAIALVGLLIALPTAFATRRGGWLTIVAVIPLLVPSYLAFSGWGVLRDPGSAIGAWLGSGPAWRSVIAGRLLAIVALGLWASPLAWLILAPAARALDPEAEEALRLEPCSWPRRACFFATALRGPLLLAWGGVAMVMLGSAVPLHLAQFDTLSIRVWARLDELPFDRRWEALAAAWPLALPALAGGVATWAWSSRRGTESESPARHRGSRPFAASVAWMAWAAAAPIPVALMAWSMRDPGRLLTFWRESGAPFAASCQSAVLVGALGAALAVLAMRAAGCDAFGRTVTRAVVACFVAAGLTPGVIVGLAIAQRWSGGPGAVEAAHLARYAFVGVGAGLWVALSEEPSLRAMRLLDAGHSLRGWIEGVLVRHVGVVTGVGVAIAALSLHEIEATIIVEPPGRGTFAREMLSFLHFFRMEQLAAGVVYVAAVSAACAIVATVLVRIGSGRVRG